MKRDRHELPDIDAETIAYSRQQKALSEREVSVAGLLRMLELGARDHMVIDPWLLDMLAQRGAHDPVVAEAVPALRARLASKRRPAVKDRLLYALVRLLGPDAPEVPAALRAGGREEYAVLAALTDRIASEESGPVRALFEALPRALLPHVAPLFAQRADRVLVDVAVRIPSGEVVPFLLRALEEDDLRSYVLTALAERVPSEPAGVPPEVVARFAQAADEIARARGRGFPDRVALVIAAGIAAVVPRHREIATRALAIFDLVPGPVQAGQMLRERLLPFCRLLSSSVDLLAPEDQERLASFLGDRVVERFEPAARAWVRLPTPRALGMVPGWTAGDPTIVAQRWEAAARAYAGLDRPPRELAHVFVERGAAAGITPALAEAIGRGDPDALTRIVHTLLRKAPGTEPLRAALELALRHSIEGVVPIALERLRDSKIRIDPALEAALVPLIDEDSVSLVRDEIDGENPFRDRRQALARVLERAGVS